MKRMQPYGKNETNQIFLNICSCLASHIRDVVIVLPWATIKRWSRWCSGPKRTKLFWKYLFALFKCCKFACWIKQTHTHPNKQFVCSSRADNSTLCVRSYVLSWQMASNIQTPSIRSCAKRRKNRRETFKRCELCESWVTAKCRD